MSTATKIYTGPKERGHSACIYVKSNTQRAIDRIKKLNPDLASAGTTEVLDFLVQFYVDTNHEELDALEEDSSPSGKGTAPAGTRRKKRLGLPS